MRELKAYKTMFRFLDERYKSLPSDELANLLSSLSLDIWTDGSPGDPGIENEWNRAVEAVEREEAAERAAQTPILRKAS